VNPRWPISILLGVAIVAVLPIAGCGSASSEATKQARIAAGLRTLEHDLAAGDVKAPSAFREGHVLGTIVLISVRPPDGVGEVEWKTAMAHDASLMRLAKRTQLIPVAGGAPGPMIRTPERIKQAGGRQLAEYEAGEKAVAQSGCLACHKIGTEGNRGPGQNLTEVADRLPRQAIERTLVAPVAPMPSFKNAPPAKLHAMVAFLAQLK
jgi:mono/diheme cytochrome c family protein